ncbi:hypothetical protein [Luteolibacter pohnpeiensis]|nr:hypothetical protein [Luteolibacter pohnpeiensis]
MALCLGACKKKESAPLDASGNPVEVTPDVPGTPQEAEPPVVTPEAKEVVPTAKEVTPEDRAAKLGFAQYLPKDTELMVSVFQGEETVNKVKSLKLWKLIDAQMSGAGPGFGDNSDFEMDEELGMEPDIEMAPEDNEESKAAEPDDAMQEGAALGAASGGIDMDSEADSEDMDGFEEPMGPEGLLGKQVVLAFGHGSMEQAGYLNLLRSRMAYFQFREITRALVEAARTGDPSLFTDSFAYQYTAEMFTELIQDQEGGVDLFEKIQMPPIYLGFKTSAEDREEAASQIRSTVDFMGMMGEMVEPVSFEKAGVTFTGYRLLGSKLAEMLNAERDSATEMMDEATFDRFVKALSEKNIVACTGTLGDYVVLMMGSSEEELNLASDLNDSMVSSDELKFTDGYVDKDLSAVIYGQEAGLKSVISADKEFAAIFEGIRDGFAGQEGIGDTRNIEALLQTVVDRGEELVKFQTVHGYGLVSYFDEGYKIETYGGTDPGSVDWSAPRKLAHLGDSPDVVLFANGSSTEVYNEKLTGLLNSVGETVYALAAKASEIPAENVEEDKLAQYKEMFGMFDSQFREDLVNMWNGFSVDMAAGLGQEAALVMDFKGSIPTVPGIPQKVVDEGKFPRASYIAPVVDRTKLATSWDKINLSATSMMGKISTMSGMEIPMQKPISSEKDGMTTWFFPMPFFNDEFLPSVTVGDDWFVASTSKNQALDLVGKAKTGTATETGFLFKANFVALQAYARECYALVDANADEIFGDNESALNEYKHNKETMIQFIDSFDDFDSVSIKVRKEADVLRGSFHFKTR